MPGADQIFSNTESLLRALKGVAREMEIELGREVFFHVHSSENAGETRLVLDTTGLTPTGYAEKAGILDERTIIAHQVHNSPADIEILRSHRVKIVSNPSANGSLFSGIAPVHLFLENGIPVAYSTDGSGSSDHQDAFAVMYVGVMMNRGFGQDAAKLLTDHQALQMILTTPARIYNLNADSLEPGKDATFIVYDISPDSNPAIIPHSADTIFGKLVFCDPSGIHVTHSLSMGEWTVQDSQVVTMDVNTVMGDIARLDEIYWNEVYPTLKVSMGTGTGK